MTGLSPKTVGAIRARASEEIPHSRRRQGRDGRLRPLDSSEGRLRAAVRFRALAKDLGATAASLAHRYALSMPHVGTVVLGVKNRAELDECLAAEAAGPLPAAVMHEIDACVPLRTGTRPDPLPG